MIVPKSGYAESYKAIFSDLGRPLKRSDSLRVADIRAAADRLEIPIPESLKEFYRVAGLAQDFHSVHDRYLLPDDWCLLSEYLVFMEENQAVVIYAIRINQGAADDPAVYYCANQEPYVWTKVSERCSEFIKVTLLWSAGFGGAVPHCATARVSPEIQQKLDKNWSYTGAVNEMSAYQKPGRSVCFLEWGDEWRMFVAARDATELQCVEKELGVTFEGQL